MSWIFKHKKHNNKYGKIKHLDQTELDSKTKAHSMLGQYIWENQG